MTFALRDYQQRDVRRLRAAIAAGHGRILYQLPTGGGKTVLMAWMAARAAERGKRTMFIVHRQELLLQASRTFEAMGIDHGLIAPGHTMSRDVIQVASVLTLVRRFDRVVPPDLIVFDEAHHCPSNTWLRVFGRYPGAKAIGLTATPCRLDGRGLDDLFEIMICGPTARDLIDTGFLSDYVVYAPPIGIDLRGVRTRAGDFAKDQLAEAVDRPTITGDAVRHYLRLAQDKRAIAFCVSIDHSKHVAERRTVPLGRHSRATRRRHRGRSSAPADNGIPRHRRRSGPDQRRSHFGGARRAGGGGGDPPAADAVPLTLPATGRARAPSAARQDGHHSRPCRQRSAARPAG